MDYFKDKEITKTDWIIIIASVVLLVILSLVFLVVINSIDVQIDGVNRQITDAQTRLSETRAIAAKKEDLLKELEEVKLKIASFEGRLPTEKEIPKLLNQFQKIAALSGVKYRSITAEAIDPQNLYIRIPFKLKIEGTYPEVGQFLRSLEFGNRFIKVEKIGFEPEKEGRSRADFTISTYMFVTD